MDALFASGHVADAVLAVMAIEAVVLAWLWRDRRGAGLRIALLLLPGAGLAVSLRIALADGSSHWIALALTVAFIAHVADVAVRHRDMPR